MEHSALLTDGETRVRCVGLDFGQLIFSLKYLSTYLDYRT